MRKIFLSCFLLTTSVSALGKQEACEISGNSALWVMAYCMSIYETDDDAHPGVNDCFIRERRTMNKKIDEICEVNYKYKLALCSLSKGRELIKDTLSECLESKGFVPSIVKNGGI